MSEIIRVKIADYGVLKAGGHLITVGLGSCIGIALYDSSAKVAGLAHILLSDSTTFRKNENKAKFADTAIPLLIKDMEMKGAVKRRIVSKIAGGSSLFAMSNNKEGVGSKNIKAVVKTLDELGVPLLGKDVGGNKGRTMKVYAEDGKVTVSTVGTTERVL